MKYRTWTLLFGTAYASTSYYFLQHPEKLHVKNQRTKAIMDKEKILFAHRGGSIENPENTLQAFKSCKGKDIAIETDVRSTKDGQIIVAHDDDLSRITGKDVKVS